MIAVHCLHLLLLCLLHPHLYADLLLHVIDLSDTNWRNHISVVEKTLEEIRSADYVVVGEGEESFLDLINSLDKKGQLYQPIDGVVSRGSNNFKPRKLIQNLDSIPFPKRDFYDKSNYIFGEPLFTSRGCPFSCTFCASHLTWTRKVRYRSVENVINELKAIKIKFNAKRIRILDDTFILNKKWVMEFCNALKKNNMQFTFNVVAG